MSLALYWFTEDLRIDDNPALQMAASHDRLSCWYCIDERWFRPTRYQTVAMGCWRWRFIAESVVDLQQQLRSYRHDLNITRGKPVAELVKAITQLNADVLVLSRRVGWQEQRDLALIRASLPGLTVIECDTYTAFNHSESWLQPEQLAKQFTPFRRQAEQRDWPPTLARPAHLPPMPTRQATVTGDPAWQPITSNAEQGFRGGATAAQRHLDRYFNSDAPASYQQSRNALSGWQHSAKLSPWLNQGCIAVRQVKQRLEAYQSRHGANESTQWLVVELLWREYFQWSARKLQSRLFKFQGTAKTGPLTAFYPERFRRWCEGNTPYPLVNACMQELKQTGYLSNRGRQIVASCFVNELGLDWRYGAAWFQQQLIDYDVAVNWGNWQYIAGVGVDPRGGRHFNLTKQAEQFDPQGDYTRRWASETAPAQLDTVDAADWPILADHREASR